MSYTLNPQRRYRSPIHFGPQVGPRQGPAPDYTPFDLTNSPVLTVAAFSYLTDLELMSRLLPENMTVHGEPIVTLEVQEFSELEWLAGRGYRTVNVKFPVQYQGKTEQLTGQFLAVMWENLADPIISGREELGYNKIFCDIAAEINFRGVKKFSAGWDGHKFFEMELEGLREAQPGDLEKFGGDGILHVKYVPGTGHSAPPDAHYVTLTPSAATSTQYEQVLLGEGNARFVQSTWEQLPTLYHIVNALSELPIIEARGAMYARTRGGRDLSDVRRVD